MEKHTLEGIIRAAAAFNKIKYNELNGEGRNLYNVTEDIIFLFNALTEEHKKEDNEEEGE
jgi:hypothetical protein